MTLQGKNLDKLCLAGGVVSNTRTMTGFSI